MASSTGDSSIGEIIAGRYRIIKELGRGGLGVVYKALDMRLQRMVALKVLSHDFDAESQQRFMNEARIAHSLDHPNIVRTFDFEQDANRAYVIVDYVEGSNLREFIAERGPIDTQSAIEIIQQAGRGLEYLHQHGIIHRDVKPSNILISNDGSVLLTDLGLAIPSGTLTLNDTGISGTPAYMSPEQAVGGKVDASSDVFSLGIILYEILTGQHPFSTGSSETTLYNIVESSPKPAHQLNPAVSEPVAEVLVKALEKEPQKRFRSCTEFLAALDRTSRETSRAPSFGGLITSFQQFFSGVLSKARREREPETTAEEHPTQMALPPYKPPAQQRVSLSYRYGLASLYEFDDAGLGHEFKLGPTCTIGRRPDNDLVIESRSVSRVHARIDLENDRFWITNLSISGGTFVNGKRIERCELQDGDEISMGRDKTLIFVQAVTPALHIEGRRRLKEFDSIWGKLIIAARDE
jgi:serine/threonine protein kinase